MNGGKNPGHELYDVLAGFADRIAADDYDRR